MKNENTMRWAVASGMILSLSGCGQSEPSFGERVQGEGAEVATIGKSWQRGDAMIKRGQKLIETGESQQKKGKKNVRKGEDLIEEGRKLKQRAEADYEIRKPSPATSATPAS